MENATKYNANAVHFAIGASTIGAISTFISFASTSPKKATIAIGTVALLAVAISLIVAKKMCKTTEQNA